MQPAVAPAPGDAPTASDLSETFEMFRRVGLAIRARFQEAMAEHGLTFSQWFLLKQLRQNGPFTVSELAAAMDVTSANVTGMVDRLERDDLVARERSAEDRRVVIVRLTPAGVAKIRAIEQRSADRVLGEAFAGWSRADLAALRAMLARLNIQGPAEC